MKNGTWYECATIGVVDRIEHDYITLLCHGNQSCTLYRGAGVSMPTRGASFMLVHGTYDFDATSTVRWFEPDNGVLLVDFEANRLAPTHYLSAHVEEMTELLGLAEDRAFSAMAARFVLLDEGEWSIARLAHSAKPDDDLLCRYKGPSTPREATFVYAPYIPLITVSAADPIMTPEAFNKLLPPDGTAFSSKT